MTQTEAAVEERPEVGGREVSRLFATAVQDPRISAGFSLCLIPHSALPPDFELDPAAIFSSLGLDPGPEVPSPTLLPFALAAMVNQHDPGELVSVFESLPNRSFSELSTIFSPELLEFAEYVAFADLLALEESPIRRIALATVHVVRQAVEGAAAGLAVGAGIIALGVAGTAAAPVLIVAGTVGIVLLVVDDERARTDIVHAAHAIVRGLR